MCASDTYSEEIKMAKQDTRTSTEFLAQDVYLPGWMLVRKEDYSGQKGTFTFQPREFPIIRGEILHYLTPRGFHVFLSQASYCLIEEQVRNSKIDGDIALLRPTLLSGRVKITDLNLKMRKSIPLTDITQAEVKLMRFREGKLPIAKFSFDVGNRGFSGYFISQVASSPQPQLNADIIRRN